MAFSIPKGAAPGLVGTHLVKGLGHAMGTNPTHGEIMDAARLAEEVLREAIEPAQRGYSIAEDWEKVSDEFRPGLMKLASPDALMKVMAEQIQQLATGLQKDISLTSPVSTGLVPFDLEAPAKLQYPTGSPLRNKIARTKGQGVAHRFKKVTAISGSQQDFTGAFFINELPGGSFNALNFPPAISMTGADAIVNYAYAGLGNNAGLLTELAGRGFQDIEALLTLTLLQSMMLQEEGAMLYGRYTSALARPGTPTVTAQTPSAGYTALTGVTTNVYVKVSAISGMGETLASASAGNAAPSGSQDVKVTWTDVPGAVAYKVYISTGGSDPGDASRFLMATVSTNFVELGGALPTSGSVAVTTATTQQTNGYDGFIADLQANGGSSTRLNGPFTSGAPEMQVPFQNIWQAVRGNPDEVWMAGPDRLHLSQNYLKDSSGVGAYRVTYTRDEAGRISGGQVINSMWNETTGKEVPVTVHPWLQQGNALILSYQIPYPNSNTPNTYENVMVQDYLGLSFPNIDLARRFAIVMYGALVSYAPIYSGVMQGIQNA